MKATDILDLQAIDKNVINGAVDLNLSNGKINGDVATFHMNYGDWTQPTSGGAIQKRSTVDADITLSLTNLRLNNDGSVTVTVNTAYRNFKRAVVDASGINLALTIHIYSSQERTNEKFTRNDHTNGPAANFGNVDFSCDITIPARSTLVVGAGRYWNDLERTTVDDEFIAGIRVFNPNYPDYRPGSRMVNGVEESCNRSGGWACRMVDGKEVELRTKIGNSTTGDPPYRKINNEERNQNKIGLHG